MNISIDDVKILVKEYQESYTAINKKFVPVPNRFVMPDFDNDFVSNSVANFVRNHDLKNAPKEAIDMHEKLVKDLTNFSNIINSKHIEALKINEAIDLELNELNTNFIAKISQIPEYRLNNSITINKKDIDPDDFNVFVDIYKSIGITNYLTDSSVDVLYYSESFNHFKENLINKMPKYLRKKYPNILSYIKKEIVNTNPIYSDGLYKVMLAKNI